MRNATRTGGRMAMLAAVMLLVLVSAGHVFAQAVVPDTPAGKALQGWLAAFNSGDAAAYRAFVEKNWPSGVKRVDQIADFRAQTGGFDLRQIEASSTPTKLTALVQEKKSDTFARLTLEMDAAQPNQIATLGLRAIPRPAEFALPHMSLGDLIAAAREKLQKDAAADAFAGAVLIAKDGKPVFSQAYGLADRERKIPNTLQTRFRIGSMNKMFTAVSIMQLAQAGKLKLTDPLGKFVPDYPNKDVAAKVTIEQMLTHTGGTGDFFGPEFDAHRLELRTLDDYVKLLGKRAPEFEPGSKHKYSNFGFILLGVVIEKVSGDSYYDYVRKHVYAPAGMTSTASEPESQAVADRSIGYMHDEAKGAPADKLVPNTDTLPYRGTSAGGGYSTVGDFLRFANALEQHKLLDAQHTELLTTGKVDAGGGRYAYGFADQTINGLRCFGHSGGAPGMNGDLEICPGNHTVVVVLANMDPGAATTESDFITNRLPKE
jgi:D-alanyl-D-alanine carboxypeptidase